MPYRKLGALLPDPLSGYALRQFCMSIPDAPEYRQAFWGQVWQLGNETFWQKDTPDDDRAEIAAQVWREILQPVQMSFDALETCELTDACQSYPNTATFIQYFPNDPRYSPDLVPEGYNSPPWYFATLLAQVSYLVGAGDIVTTIDRFPPGSLPSILPASGLPRIRVSVFGEGMVRLHLTNQRFGSLMQITIDDNPLTAFFVDMNRDELSAPPESADQSMVEVKITGPGAHVVDAIVVSKVNDEIPFLYHGGGLKYVELCGLTPNPQGENEVIRLAETGFQIYNISTDSWEAIETDPQQVVGSTTPLALRSLLGVLEAFGMIDDQTTFGDEVYAIEIDGGDLLLTKDDDPISTVELPAAGGLQFIDRQYLLADQPYIAFTGIPNTFDHLALFMRIRDDNPSRTDNVLITFNGDNASGNYRAGYTAVTTDTPSLAGSAADALDVGFLAHCAAGDDCPAGHFANVFARLNNYAIINNPRMIQAEYSLFTYANRLQNGQAACEWDNTADEISSILLQPSGGTNFLAGSYATLYGVRGS